MQEPQTMNIRIDYKPGKIKVICSNLNTTITVMGTTTKFSWDTDLYNRSGCIKSIISKKHFGFAECKLRKSFVLAPVNSNGW
jgi:hypothetical protein